jgi:hypothetical protein
VFQAIKKLHNSLTKTSWPEAKTDRQTDSQAEKLTSTLRIAKLAN